MVALVAGIPKRTVQLWTAFFFLSGLTASPGRAHTCEHVENKQLLSFGRGIYWAHLMQANLILPLH